MANYEMLGLLDTCHGLDMIALSAAVVNNIFGLSLRAALRRSDFKCRFVLFDPSPETATHYDTFARRVIDESPTTKRGQFEELHALSTRFPDQVEIKVIRGMPLMFNAWVVRDKEGVDYRGHLSVYMYEAARGGPAIRVGKSNPLLKRIRDEFNYVWRSAAVEFEAAK
jgi:hypothetical protein